MKNVAIVGASGYTGGELLRMLSVHPEVEVTEITSRKLDGQPVHKTHPHIRDTGLVFKDKKPSDIDADVIFTATPHGASMKIVPELLETGAKVVDLSGDYRYRNTEVYEKWYGMKHTDKKIKVLLDFLNYTEMKLKKLIWYQIQDASQPVQFYHHILLLKMIWLKKLSLIQNLELVELV